MNKKIIGLIILLSIVVLSAIPAYADEVKNMDKLVSINEEQDEEVKAAFEAYVELKMAMNNKNMSALLDATKKIEQVAEKLSDEQQDKLVSMDEDFFYNIISAATVGYTYELKEAFLANKNVSTAKDLYENYKLHFLSGEIEDTAKLIRDMIPDIDSVYNEVLNYLPSENVLTLFEAYNELKIVLYMTFADDVKEFVEKRGEEILLLNDLDANELEQLAVLLEEENGNKAFERILSDWIDANMLMSVNDAYQDFLNKPNKTTAKKFVEMYYGVFDDPNYVDESYRELVNKFFIDIHDVYADAKEILLVIKDDKDNNDLADNKQVEKDTEKDKKEENIVKGTAPDTGDSALVATLMVLAISGVAMIFIRKKLI